MQEKGAKNEKRKKMDSTAGTCLSIFMKYYFIFFGVFIKWYFIKSAAKGKEKMT